MSRGAGPDDGVPARPGLLAALVTADRWLARAEGTFVGAVLAFTSGLLFVNVILRYVFLRPLHWAEELTLYLMAWAVFVGGSIIVRTRGHIAVDVLPIFLSGRRNRQLRIGIALVSTVFLVALAYYSGQHTLRVRSSGQVMPAIQAPMWLAYLALPVGSLLMALRMAQTLGRLWRSPEGVRVEIDVRD